MTFTDIQTLLKDDLSAVDALIHDYLHSKVALAKEVAAYVVNSGGKRIRPILTLLSAKAFGYEGTEHQSLAALVEMLHTATLLHDDVIDGSELRRGRKTANTLWGNQTSILVGDFLHARSFQAIARLNNKIITDILAAATSFIVEGELLQLEHCHDPKTSEETYLDIIKGKTGKLFEVSTHVGPALCHASEESCHAMRVYGQSLGMAFQMVDDALDYAGDVDNIGKNIGDDLAEGKPTLPLIYVLENGNDTQRTVIKNALKENTDPDIAQIKQVIDECNAIDYVQGRAKQFVQDAQDALIILPESTYRDALHDLAAFSIQRQV